VKIIEKITQSNKWVCLLLLVLVFVSYASVLKAPFKKLDDNISIVNNDDIKDFANVGEIFTSSYFGDNHYYRPLVSFSYMLEYHFFGLNPFFYYLNNILLHAGIAMIVFFLLVSIFEDRKVAFITALLFAIHPIQWEAVTNISGRSIILNTFFLLNAFLLFCLSKKREGGRGFICLSMFFFILALLSKESAVMLPLLLLAYSIIFQQEKKMKGFFSTIPYFVMVVIYIIIRKLLDFGEVYTWHTFEWLLLGFLTFLRGCLTYLRLFILPIDLHFDRSRTMFTSFADVELLLTVAVFILFLMVIIKYRSKFSKGVLFFFCWFAIALLPVSQIVASIGVQPGSIMLAEHFLYSASIGIFVMMALGLRKVDRSQLCSRQVLQWTTSLLLAFFMITTIQQSIYASNAVSMLKQSVKYNPRNARALYSLGLEMADIGQYKQAEEYFRRSLRMEPHQPIARIGLGKSLCDQKRYTECIKEYERVIYPGKFTELLEENLHIAYNIVLKDFQNRLLTDGENPQLHYSLGVMYSKLSKGDEAIDHFREAVHLDPQYRNALFNLASILEGQGQLVDSKEYYEKILTLEAKDDEIDRYSKAHLDQINQQLNLKVDQ